MRTSCVGSRNHTLDWVDSPHEKGHFGGNEVNIFPHAAGKRLVWPSFDVVRNFSLQLAVHRQCDLLPDYTCVFCSFTEHRSDNFTVGLTDVSPAVTAPTLWDYDVCAQYPGVVNQGATVNLTCTSCMMPRRYLIVQTERAYDHISFCEIQIFVDSKLILVSSSKYKTKVPSSG